MVINTSKIETAGPQSDRSNRFCGVLIKLAFACCGLIWVMFMYFSGTSKEGKLWRLISAADQVRLQESWQGRIITRSFYGEQACRIVQMIMTAKPLGPDMTNGTATIEFLRGSNHLALIRNWCQCIYVNGKSYFVGDFPLMGSPIYFSIPDDFQGMIYLTLDMTNGSKVSRSNSEWMTVPADGQLRVRDQGVLYSWAERAYFITNRERIPVDTDPGSLGVLPADAVALRSLGTYGTNGISFIAFFLGTAEQAKTAKIQPPNGLLNNDGRTIFTEGR
jgi:hypothetical protein